LVLLNTPFYANGLKLGQAKGLFDGILDCCIINTGSFFETLGYGLHILHRPKSTNSRKDILLHSNWFTISMTGAEIMDIQVDGEIIEGTKRIEVTMIPGCLDVFSN
jgi:diacylglycerol kinase family enzyme